MCNFSEVIIERGMERGIKLGIERGIEQGIKQGMEQGMEQGIKQGIDRERINAIGRMIKGGATKGQILSYGYTEDEFAKAEGCLYAYA